MSVFDADYVDKRQRKCTRVGGSSDVALGPLALRMLVGMIMPVMGSVADHRCRP
ncbi:hypothetical protein ACT009_01405 [Sphingomonas sp. Tas61C01]|uniref:hypothetical protein n=1 Tax=Sphingomonas sp. Tas61C01 TaxID=3458297 RepID=UPI00403E3BE0